MKEDVFLRYFKKHAEFFLGKRVITRERILYNLKYKECPFTLRRAMEFPKWSNSRYLGKCGKKLVHRYDAEKTFQRNMKYFVNIDSLLTRKMIKIVRAIKVKAKKEEQP